MRLLVSILVLASPCVSSAKWYPAAAEVIRVTDLGADGTDQQLDTAAFLAARDLTVNTGRIMNVPCGDYVVDQPIEGKVLHNGEYKWAASWIVEAEDWDCVTIRIPDNSPAFQNPAAPKGLFATGSTVGNSPNPGSGSGNEAFRNSISDMTIRIGAGNPGAVGIDWVCSNRGAIRRVRIIFDDPQRAGVAGIWMGRVWPGPCLVADSEVIGSDRAMFFSSTQYSMVVRDVEIREQRVDGIYSPATPVQIERLHSINTVPVVRAASTAGQTVILNSHFEGGDPTRGAIEFVDGAHGFVRGVTSTGYGATIKYGGVAVPQAHEWVSHPIQNPYGDATAASLDLPVPAIPVPFQSSTTADWADVRDYGATMEGGADDTAGVQAALDSGKPIIYFPHITSANAYHFSGTMTVPCSVRRLVFMESRLAHSASLAGAPLFLLDAGCAASDVLSVESAWFGVEMEGGAYVEHRDARTVLISSVQLGGHQYGYRSSRSAGPAFLDDVLVTNLDIKNRVYAWQLNPESALEVDGITVSEGGLLRVLGMKTEGMAKGGRATLTAQNARVELLGGMMMPCVLLGTGEPLLGFDVKDSDFSATYVNWCGKAFELATWATQVRDQRVAEVRTVTREDLPLRYIEGGNRVFMDLYSSRGYVAPAPLPDPDPEPCTCPSIGEQLDALIEELRARLEALEGPN